MRGAQNLFSNFLENDEPETMPVSRNSGRDKALLLKRDIKLVHRHYYYLKIRRLQYPDIMANLSREFDIADYTIIERLQKEDNHRLLSTIIKEAKKVSDLKKEYPFLVW